MASKENSLCIFSLLQVPIIKYGRKYYISTADLKFYLGHNQQVINYLKIHRAPNPIRYKTITLEEKKRTIKELYRELLCYKSFIKEEEKDKHIVLNKHRMNRGLSMFKLVDFLTFMERSIEQIQNYVEENDYLIYKQFYFFNRTALQNNVYDIKNYKCIINVDQDVVIFLVEEEEVKDVHSDVKEEVSEKKYSDYQLSSMF
ncbi:hypothetical protein ABK040_016384 [Willaertia magna]